MKLWIPLIALLASWPGTQAIASDTPRVRIETTAGVIVVQLDAARAPLSVKNFLQYVQDGFYDGTIFHRVVNGFVIQGGGYARDLKVRKPRSTIPNESGNCLTNHRGTLAMARTADPHSADSQFFISLADNFSLDPKPTRWGYAVFGEVVEGMEVVDDIGHRATNRIGTLEELPVQTVTIEHMTVVPGNPK